MDKVQFKTGVKRILINDGPDFLEFNPLDTLFVDRFYAVYNEFNQKEAEFTKQAKAIDKRNDDVDANGVPANIQETIDFVKEVCTYMRGRIDYLFGNGTSQKLFGDVLSMEVISDFLTAITPFVQTARSDKLAKYAGKKTKVMKQL